MKNIYLFCFALILPFAGNSQNLVPNPSFENYTEPFCGIMYPPDFELTIDDWLNPNLSAPSLYFTNLNDSCYNQQPENNYPGPIGQKGTQLPRTGEVMAGIWLYTFEGLNQRQYVQVLLNNNLEIGQQYIVEFYVSHADHMEYFTSNIQAFFSLYPEGSSSSFPIEVTPQLSWDDFVVDQEGWVRIADTISVEEPLQYLTIGNFQNDENTTLLTNENATGEPGTYGAYYFIDDVSVTAYIPDGIDELYANSIKIYPTVVTSVLNIEIEQSLINKPYFVTDLHGKNVLQGNIYADLFSLDVEKLPAGMYSFNLDIDGVITSKTFIRK